MRWGHTLLAIVVLGSGCSGSRLAAAELATPQPPPAVHGPTPRPSSREPAPIPAAPAAGPNPATALRPDHPDAIGTHHPMVVLHASRNGAWVAMCQARSDTNGDGKVSIAHGHHGSMTGDELQPYLAHGAGPGQPVDGFGAQDPTGRHIAVLRAGMLILVDTQTNTQTPLAKPEHIEARWRFGYGLASFDDRGQRMVYIRGVGTEARVIVRTLATGHERTIHPGPGKLWFAAMDPGGALVWVKTIPKDTNGDAKLGLPNAIQDAGARKFAASPTRCTTATHWRAQPFPRGSDDLPVIRVASARKGGRARGVGKALGAMGSTVVVRRRNGAVVALDGAKSTQIIGPRCNARVLHIDPRRRRVYAVCRRGDEETLAEVVAFSTERRMPQGVFIDRNDRGAGIELGAPREGWPHGQILIVENDARALDLERGQVIALGGYTWPLLRVDGRTVIVSVDSTVIHGPGPRDKTTIATPFLPDDFRVSGAKVAYFTSDRGTDVLDVQTAVVTGPVPARAFAVDGAGRVLVRVGYEDEQVPKQRGNNYTQGPLRWVETK